MNTTTPLSANATWSSTLIDLWSDTYNMYKTITFSAMSDKGYTMNALCYNANETPTIIAQRSVASSAGAKSLTVTPKAQYFQVQVINGSTNQTSLDVATTFHTDAYCDALCDNNGTPISDLNPLQVSAVIHDSNGNSIGSTSNALNVYVSNSGGGSSTNIKDSSGNNLNSTSNALNVYVANAAATMNMKDSSGNSLSSTTGSLNVNVTNSPSSTVKIQDSAGNNLNSTSNALNVSQVKLNVSTDSVKAVLYDSAFNGIVSTNGGVRTADFINDVMNGLYPGNGSFSPPTGQIGLNKIVAYGPSISNSLADVNTLGNVGMYPFSALSTSNSSVYICSTSALDTYNGTGAQQVRVIGLDNIGSNQSVAVTLNGTSHVNIAGAFSVVYSAYVIAGGSTKCNQGVISIYATTGNIEVMNIVPYMNTSTFGYYAPNGSIIISSIIRNVNVQSTVPMNVIFRYKPSSGFFSTISRVLCNGQLNIDLKLLMNSGDSFIVSAQAVSTTGSVTVQFEPLEFS